MMQESTFKNDFMGGQEDYDPSMIGDIEYVADNLVTNNEDRTLNDTTSPGSFYQLAPPYSPHIQSAPVSALAIDPNKDALYVAGHTITLNRKRPHATYSTPGMSSNGNTMMEQRVSMLATHSFPDGTLYSSCAGHDEAGKDVLNSISSCLYGSSISSTDTAAMLNQTRNKIPTHAYHPPYGSLQSHLSLQNAAFRSSPFDTPNVPQMGINTILPFSCSSQYCGDNSESGNAESYICSISPSSVRVHSNGGLLIAENKTEGMLAGTFHPGGYQEGIDENVVGGLATHITVGGIATNDSGHNIHCMDLYSSGLKSISSYAVRSDNAKSKSVCVADLVTNYDKGNVIAGCSDGTLRIFDGAWRSGNFIECARVKAHGGGVAQVVARDNLICTTGYSSRSSAIDFNANNAPCTYPDQHLLIFDVRFLGRGGIVHPFSGLKGGPRFISFINDESQGSRDQTRILVASGQNAGGLQIITPFESLEYKSPENFVDYFHPPLGAGENITAMSHMGKDLAIGTSHGNVLQYQIGEERWNGISSRPGQKEQLIAPSYVPDAPELSIEPSVLQSNFVDQNPNCVYRQSIFNSFIFQEQATLSYLGNEVDKNDQQSFGPLSNKTLIQSEKRILSNKLSKIVSDQEVNDFLTSIPSSQLGLDLLSTSGRKNVLNPNRLLFSKRLSAVCYDMNADPRRNNQSRQKRDDATNVNERSVPQRYKCKYRPPYSLAFDVASLNSTIYPGWDYAPSMPNAYASPVLLLLYFIPEIRNAMIGFQLKSMDPGSLDSPSTVERKQNSQVPKDRTPLSAELGFLFHQIDTIAANAMTYPKDAGNNKECVVGAFVPLNFLSALSVLPEASALAVLDGEAAAVEVSRRPEAFHRFLLYHLDRELNSVAVGGEMPHNGGLASKNPGIKNENLQEKDFSPKLNLIDSLQGMNSVIINEFITGSGPPSVSSTRSYILDLAYDTFLSKTGEVSVLPYFGDVLRYSLCKDIRLRAWCQSTKSYETVIQRKILTSLPDTLSICCSCSGDNSKDRLQLWRKSEEGGDHWLPEVVEVEIESNGNIITRQLISENGNAKEWQSFSGSELSNSVSNALRNACNEDFKGGKRCARYRLDAVLSFVRDKDSEKEQGRDGHHVLHKRVSKQFKNYILRSQIEKTSKCMTDASNYKPNHLTLVSDVTIKDFQERIKQIKQDIDDVEEEGTQGEWVLFNGPVVSETIVEDARAFHVSFKEPCILMFEKIKAKPALDSLKVSKIEIPHSVIYSNYKMKNVEALPGRGDLVAFDAEFVSVQHEESILTSSGSKVTVREGRNALARMSLIDCRTGKVIIDDHILPREPVVDCLTRFSGIRFTDLDPTTSPYKLITTTNAYLKIRYFVERGCIFVGHGLNQDFFTVNLHVSPCQIIDTLLIFHLEKRRFISLRFLVNYLLGRDMQQDVHDSVEDARAAHDLYVKALELKKEKRFDIILEEIYDHGQRNDWKVGVDDRQK